MRNAAGLVRTLYRIVDELHREYGRPFTLDGHLVGSIGEVLAAARYGLTLLPPSTPGHDAKACDDRLVQVKATQGDRVGLYAKPDHLLVLRLQRDGSAEEVFNGPGEVVWAHMSRAGKNGQRSICVTRLRRLMQTVPAEQRLAEEAIG